MLVIRKLALHTNETDGFQIGDQISLRKGMTATCQFLSFNLKTAIFLMDYLLDKPRRMTDTHVKYEENGYERSTLKMYLDGFDMHPIFKDVHSMMVPFDSGDWVRIPTVEEIFQKRNIIDCFSSPHQKFMELMKNPKNKMGVYNGSYENDAWWLQNSCNKSSTSVACVSSIGDLVYLPSTLHCGVRLMFQLRNNF